jgi:hypothetical protein
MFGEMVIRFMGFNVRFFLDEKRTKKIKKKLAYLPAYPTLTRPIFSGLRAEDRNWLLNAGYWLLVASCYVLIVVHLFRVSGLGLVVANCSMCFSMCYYMPIVVQMYIVSGFRL